MSQEKKYLVHPEYIIIFLVLAGITALFLGFSVAYIYNRVQFGLPSVKLPNLFYFNTMILLTTSYLLTLAKKAYLDDDTVKYERVLWYTLVLTILFLVLQILAWMELHSMNIQLSGSDMGSYLYVISGMHFAHVIAGIPFLAYFIYVAHYRMKEPVSVLIYFTDPNKKRKLNLLTVYWHYLDFLWICLVVFFLLNYLI